MSDAEALSLALWVVPVPDLGGVARHVLDATRVGIPGWRVVVLCPEGPLAERLREQGSAVTTGAFGPSAGVLSSIRTLRRIAASLRPQIVHSHLAYADIISAATHLPRGTIRVTTEHGIAGGKDIYHSSKIRSRVTALVHRVRLRRFRGIIAVSRATREAMRQHWKTKAEITVIPNGVDAPTVVRTPAVPPLRILSLARLAPEKRIGAALAAFALYRQSHPEAVFTIAGNGPLRDDLLAAADKLGVADAVSFPGFRDAGTALADADAVVQLSAWENCSYTLLDAAAHGILIVATDTGGNPEFLPASSLVRTVDPAVIASHLNNPPNATSIPLTSTVGTMCSRLFTAYLQALSEPTSASSRHHNATRFE